MFWNNCTKITSSSCKNTFTLVANVLFCFWYFILELKKIKCYVESNISRFRENSFWKPTIIGNHSSYTYQLFWNRLSQKPGGGNHLTFFGGCVPHGFPKVGSREWIFLENEGSWEQKCGKLASWNSGQNKAENAFFFWKLKMGAHKPHVNGKLVGKGAPTGLKKGVMTTNISAFQCECPIPGLETCDELGVWINSFRGCIAKDLFLRFILKFL